MNDEQMKIQVTKTPYKGIQGTDELDGMMRRLLSMVWTTQEYKEEILFDAKTAIER